MTNKDQEDKQLQDYLQGKDAISGQYRQQSGQSPPGHIDAAILAASRKAVGAGPQKSTRTFSGRWHVPMSIAAVIMLSVLVVFNLPEQSLTTGYVALPQTDDDLASSRESAVATGSFVSEFDLSVNDNAAESETTPMPQLSQALTSEIAVAADNAVVPQLDMAGPAAAPAAPPAINNEAFATGAAAAITPEFQSRAEVLQARDRELQRVMPPRQENAVSDQVTAQSSSADLAAISETPVLTECTDPRPEICTFEYLPVCAVRDTGIRCVTTPCDSTELVQYGNACAACSDPDVIGYTAGQCEQ